MKKQPSRRLTLRQAFIRAAKIPGKLFHCVNRKGQRSTITVIVTRALAVLLVSLAAASVVRAQTVAPLIVNNGDNRFVVEVLVCGRKAHLIIDTGSNITVVSDKFSCGGPEEVGHFRAASGNVSAVERIAEASIGTAKKELTVRFGQFLWMTGRVDGVLGMDFLGKFDNFTIDKKHKSLTLN